MKPERITNSHNAWPEVSARIRELEVVEKKFNAIIDLNREFATHAKSKEAAQNCLDIIAVIDGRALAGKEQST